MSKRPTSKGSGKFISSLAAADGRSPPDSPDLVMTDLFGRQVAPVRRSAPPAKSKPAAGAVGSNLFRMFRELASSYAAYAETNGLPIGATSGPKFGGSFETPARHALWESRLRAETDELGSTLYELRWKSWPMTLGESIPALRATARLTSDLASIGWPTPRTSDTNGTGMHGTGGMDLRTSTLLVGQPTSRASDGEKNVRTEEGAAREMERKGSMQDLAGAATLSGWRTPTAQSPNTLRGHGTHPDIRKAQGHTINLTDEVIACGRTSPSARDWKDTPGMATTGTNPDGTERTRLDQFPRQAHLAGWSSPTVAEREHSPEIIAKLAKKRLEEQGQTTVPLYHCEQAQLAAWPTPTAMDARRGEKYDPHAPNTTLNMAGQLALNGPARLTASGAMLTGSDAQMESGGQLNPRHSLWLMMGPFAIYWLAAAERVTRSRSRSRKPEPIATE